MRIMLDKIPQSGWLCEECQLKEDDERQKLDKTKAFQETPKASLLDEKELFPKLKTMPQEAEAKDTIKVIVTPKVPTKRHADSSEVALNSNKEAVETRIGSPGTASSSKKAALSRESSFKKQNAGKVKPVYPVPSSGSHSANSSRQNSPGSGPHASWMQARPQLSRGKFKCLCCHWFSNLLHLEDSSNPIFFFFLFGRYSNAFLWRSILFQSVFHWSFRFSFKINLFQHFKAKTQTDM